MILPLLLLATPIEAQRAFEDCLEAGADAAARAGVEVEAFEAGLPESCGMEEEALAAAVCTQRAGRDPALTGSTDGAERGREAAAAYAKGLRGVVLAGYPTLLQLRGPDPDPNRYPFSPGPADGRASPPEPVPPPLALPSPAPARQPIPAHRQPPRP